MFWTQVEGMLLIISKMPLESLAFQENRIGECSAARTQSGLMCTSKRASIWQLLLETLKIQINQIKSAEQRHYSAWHRPETCIFCFTEMPHAHRIFTDFQKNTHKKVAKIRLWRNRFSEVSFLSKKQTERLRRARNRGKRKKNHPHQPAVFLKEIEICLEILWGFYPFFDMKKIEASCDTRQKEMKVKEYKGY